MAEAMSLGISCCHVQGIEELKLRAFHLVFTSPERVMEIRELLKDSSFILHNSVRLIVVDESHTVETWTGKWYSQRFYFNWDC